MTGNAGLNYAAWQLARRGWHAMPTIRNARGSDMFVTNADESVFFGVQSKALSKRAAVPLGKDGDELRSEWWIITVNANAEAPTCYIMTRAEVETRATVDKNGGGRWLSSRDYELDEFREAWHRLEPTPSTQPTQHGVQRPRPETLCGRAWALLDRLAADADSPVTVAAALAAAEPLGLNANNVRTEFYRWRTYNGLGGEK
nr:hypothetical protein [uncultured Brevundimonas sp.]